MIIALVLLMLLLCSPVQAARLEITGFESGSTIECQATAGTLSVQSTTVYTGTYALQTNPTSTAVGYCSLGITAATGAVTTGGGTGTVYTTFRFRAATLPASGSEELFVAEGLTSTFKLHLRITSAGKLQVYNTTGTTQLGSDGTTTLTTGTWYLLSVSVGTGATAAYAVSVNGVTELSGTGDLSTNGHAVRTFGKRTNRNGQTVDFFYDDIATDDASAPPGNLIVVLTPNANGSTMAWGNGTGPSDYTQVDEVVPSATDYVQSQAAGGAALFRVTVLPGTVGTTIAAVKGMQYVSENSAGTSVYASRIRSGSTNSDSTTSDLGGTASVIRQRLLETDPATAAAWTVSAVNTVEVGGNDNASSTRLRLAWAAVMVEVSAPAAGPVARSRVSVY